MVQFLLLAVERSMLVQVMLMLVGLIFVNGICGAFMVDGVVDVWIVRVGDAEAPQPASLH
jgi:hypothetical protein